MNAREQYKQAWHASRMRQRNLNNPQAKHFAHSEYKLMTENVNVDIRLRAENHLRIRNRDHAKSVDLWKGSFDYQVMKKWFQTH